MQELSKSEASIAFYIEVVEVLIVVMAGVILIHPFNLLAIWRRGHIETGGSRVILADLH